MFLKRIEIYGFKSFAEKTVFDFEKGITCVIGPNGTGKSNLVEAILWVLGSQSPRELRGSKMEDIIFNGSNRRKPLGFTYVTIILDNSDRLIDLDYTEISITRKFYRSGESEFYINNVECRLKDIIDMFTDTGLGKNGYSIIGQGKIDEILNSRPEEKRRLIEEAAGIIKYKNKRYESMKKLDVTQDNLNRLNDIITELHGRLVPLYEESVKARQYVDISKKYRSYRINYFLMNYKKNKSEIDIILKDIEKERDKFEVLKSTNTNAESKLRDLNTLIENLKTGEASLNTDIYSAKNKLEKTKGDINLINLQLSSCIKEYENTRQKIRVSLNDLKRLKKEAEEFRTKMIDLTSKSSQMEAEEKKYVKNIAIIVGAIEKINIINDTIKIQKDNLEKEILIRKNELKHIDIEITRKAENLNDFEIKNSEMISLKQEIEERIKGLIYERKRIKKMISSINIEIKELQKQIELNKNIFIRFSDESNGIKRRIQIINTRIKALEDMKRNYEGLNEGSRYLLSLNDKGIYGFVGGLIELNKKYERAIETALGASMEYLIVGSEDDAKRLISILKAKKAGRATFVPLSSVKPRGCRQISSNGFLGRASELIGYDGIYKNAMEFLLGNIYVFDCIDNAIAAAKQYNYSLRMVTLDGENISPGGLISGGFHKKSYNIFTRENELKRLKSEIEQYNSDLKSKSLQIIEMNKNIEILESKFKDFTEKLYNLSNEKTTIDEQLKHLVSNHKNIEKELENLNIMTGTLKKEVSETQKSYEIYQNDIINKNTKLQQMDLLVNNLKFIVYELKTRHEGLLKQFENFKINNVTSILEKQSLDKNNEELLNRLHMGYAGLENLLKDRTKLREGIKELNCTLEKHTKAEQDLIQQINSLEEKHSEIKHKITITENRLKEVTTNYKVIQDEMYFAGNTLKELEFKKERISLEIDHIISQIKDEFELGIDEAFTYEDSAICENPDLQREINILKRKMDLLGSVSMNSIDEYEKVKERYDFLSSQYHDMFESKNSLLKIIRETDKIIHERFNNFLKQANAVFRENFIKLFGGGQADIILIDKENPEESGIDIIVQPPGKRLQNMSLLSGGERAMVAIALLFSMLELNRPPFVILDEIDSALDDANIDRFVKFLKQLSKEIQFILITHRPGTADAADAIYGITMEEKGVTKKISIRFKDVADWR